MTSMAPMPSTPSWSASPQALVAAENRRSWLSGIPHGAKAVSASTVPSGGNDPGAKGRNTLAKLTSVPTETVNVVESPGPSVGTATWLNNWGGVITPPGLKVASSAPLRPVDVAMVTVSVGLPGVHDNDVVKEASGGGLGAVVVVDEVVEVVGTDVEDVVVDVDDVVDVDVDDDDVVVVGGSPANATVSKTTAQASTPTIASTVRRDLDVGIATPRCPGGKR